MDSTYYISANKDQLNIDLIVDYLRNRSYWGKDRTEQVIKTSLENSFCFGVYNISSEQVGFARVVTDFAVFAWLMDVFILDIHQGKGLGKQLISEVISNVDPKHVMRWGLGTRDAHDFYKKFGFTSLSQPEVMMERKRQAES